MKSDSSSYVWEINVQRTLTRGQESVGKKLTDVEYVISMNISR